MSRLQVQNSTLRWGLSSLPEGEGRHLGECGGWREAAFGRFVPSPIYTSAAKGIDRPVGSIAADVAIPVRGAVPGVALGAGGRILAVSAVPVPVPIATVAALWTGGWRTGLLGLFAINHPVSHPAALQAVVGIDRGLHYPAGLWERVGWQIEIRMHAEERASAGILDHVVPDRAGACDTYDMLGHWRAIGIAGPDPHDNID